jgi:putative spermidine/putrescine transport system permease protein
LAHSILAIPFVIVLVSGSLQVVGESLEKAARSLGAGRFRAFLLVTLPLIRPAIITGALFAFLTSFDEVVIALFLTGPGSTTLPRQLWESVKFDVQPTIAAVSALLIILSVVLLIVSEVFRAQAGRRRRRSRERGHR